MMSRYFLLIALVTLPVPLHPSTECEKGCQTTVAIQDCDGAAVANAKVQLKICCDGGSDTESTTDQNGEATFPYCTKDICGSRVVLSGFGVSAFDPNSCTKDGKKSRCTVKMCKR
jgi:hypothetical protein